MYINSNIDSGGIVYEEGSTFRTGIDGSSASTFTGVEAFETAGGLLSPSPFHPSAGSVWKRGTHLLPPSTRYSVSTLRDRISAPRLLHALNQQHLPPSGSGRAELLCFFLFLITRSC
ncbi:hypothetical protein R1flu_003185 [Riccia fluitans]|uniref:Uncharacterized protein n=1 Tax=Riccia fluitans TaxID=41844 RepID=A0ABD1Y8B0_9MARC